MRNLRTAAILLALMLIPSYGQASALTDQIEKAEALLASDQPKAAFDQLDQITDHFWTQSPMFVRKALFVSEIGGYGNFKEKEPVFKPNEAQMIYVEPVAFSYGKADDGSSNASWSVDYSLNGPQGTTLFEKEDFVKLGVPLTRHNREIHLKMTINLSGLKPGDYVSNYLLKDMNSDKTASFSLPFTVVE
ncbi:hypothetical protein [uncultured Cohaesibacter sp.]|uniref:hypothetical protein n=1 Tax=uncultured Cohaesibacter sp. TaxID=1002546 RepID=UPI0029C7582F|nr:hypothetical protein [uncultured Cohaesibacter sp.]